MQSYTCSQSNLLHAAVAESHRLHTADAQSGMLCAAVAELKPDPRGHGPIRAATYRWAPATPAAVTAPSLLLLQACLLQLPVQSHGVLALVWPLHPSRPVARAPAVFTRHVALQQHTPGGRDGNST